MRGGRNTYKKRALQNAPAIILILERSGNTFTWQLSDAEATSPALDNELSVPRALVRRGCMPLNVFFSH